MLFSLEMKKWLIYLVTLLMIVTFIIGFYSINIIKEIIDTDRILNTSSQLYTILNDVLQQSSRESFWKNSKESQNNLNDLNNALQEDKNNNLKRLKERGLSSYNQTIFNKINDDLTKHYNIVPVLQSQVASISCITETDNTYRQNLSSTFQLTNNLNKEFLSKNDSETLNKLSQQYSQTFQNLKQIYLCVRNAKLSDNRDLKLVLTDLNSSIRTLNHLSKLHLLLAKQLDQNNANAIPNSTVEKLKALNTDKLLFQSTRLTQLIITTSINLQKDYITDKIPSRQNTIITLQNLNKKRSTIW
jgi:hypothetical protein